MKERCRCGHAGHDFGHPDDDDYHIQDGFAGVKTALLHHREKLIAAAKAGKPMGSDSLMSPHSMTYAAVEGSTAAISTLTVKVCEHCNAGGKLMICTGCRTVYYCSKEHQSADWRNGHKDICKTGGKRPSTSSSSDVDGERPLGLEMLELLTLFKSVHKDMPEENKEGTLRKVIHVCELIIKRGNPDNIPIPQVFYMMQEARQMIRPFVLEREGICEPEEQEQEPEPRPRPRPKLESKVKLEPKPRVELSDKQQSTKQTTARKKSGKREGDECHSHRL